MHAHSSHDGLPLPGVAALSCNGQWDGTAKERKYIHCYCGSVWEDEARSVTAQGTNAGIGAFAGVTKTGFIEVLPSSIWASSSATSSSRFFCLYSKQMGYRLNMLQEPQAR